MPQKTINTRIQLKNDTEVNWKKSVLEGEGGTKTSGTSFVPLLGELIIYSADDAHPFSRLKVGNGVTNVVQLPFIDAGTLNGEVLTDIVITAANRGDFPPIGQENKLYIDLTKNVIYCYKSTSGFSQLSHFKYVAEKTQISTISSWDPGVMTSAAVNDTSLIINNGSAPILELGTLNVVTNISEVSE